MAEPEERSLDDFFAKRDKKKKKDKAPAAAAASRGATRPPDGSQSLVTLGGGGNKSLKKDKASKSEAQDSQQEKAAVTQWQRRIQTILLGYFFLAYSLAPPRVAYIRAQLKLCDSSVIGFTEIDESSTADRLSAREKWEDDEWKEFEQKEVDYSGLRIQSLQISSEKEDDESEKKEEQGTDWEEAGGSGTDKSVGPWNKTAPAQPTVNLVTEVAEPVQPSGVYRPPAARTSAAPRKPQGPPEIFSDTQFPSLQATAKHIESRRDKEMEKTFEIVKHKNRAREEAAKNQALRLQLDNQYAVLGEQ